MSAGVEVIGYRDLFEVYKYWNQGQIEKVVVQTQHDVTLSTGTIGTQVPYNCGIKTRGLRVLCETNPQGSKLLAIHLLHSKNRTSLPTEHHVLSPQVLQQVARDLTQNYTGLQCPLDPVVRRRILHVLASEKLESTILDHLMKVAYASTDVDMIEQLMRCGLNASVYLHDILDRLCMHSSEDPERDHALLDHLLQCGQDPMSLDEDGHPALFGPIMAGQPELLERLLNAAKKVDLKSVTVATSLFNGLFDESDNRQVTPLQVCAQMLQKGEDDPVWRQGVSKVIALLQNRGSL